MPLPFQSYTEVPGQPGMLNFQRPDGSSLPLFGAAAEDYRRRIDAMRALGPQPTAQAEPAMSVESTMSDAPPPTPGAESFSIDEAMSQPLSADGDMSVSPGPDPEPEWEASRGVMPPPAQQPHASQQPQMQGAAPAESPGGQRFLSLDRTGNSIVDTASGQVITRGGGGMSRGQRDAFEGQVDARYDEIERRADEQAHFTRTQARLALEQARTEDAFVQQRMQDAQIQAAIQAENEANIRAKLEQTMLLEERSRNAYRSGTVDRDRFFSGEKGGANKAKAFLAIALGAFAQFGAGMAGRQATNPGLDMVMGRIDDDVADQERELNMKREDADNYLARAMKLDGNLAAARLATKAALLEAYQTEALAIRNQTRQPQLKLTLDQRLAELDQIKMTTVQQLMALREQTLRASMGRGQTVRPLTLEEAGKVAGLRKTQADIGQTEATTEKTGVETVGAAKKLTGDVLPEGDTGKAMLGIYRSLGNMKQQLAENARSGGDPWTPEGQNIGGKVLRTITDTVAGEKTYRAATNSPEEVARSDSFNTMRQALLSIGTQLAGAGAPSEGEAMRSSAGSAKNEQELINVINTYEPIVREKLTAYGVRVPKVELRKE